MTSIGTPLSEADLFEAGRAAREQVPRSAQAEYQPPPGRDPLGILRTQHESRLPWLVELRIERMSSDPFAFYRGTAAIQAADLHAGPNSGAEVIICGDAHLSNFGIFRSPERAMVFDINDFDEAFSGPWEWDVKRLLTSVVLAGRSLGMPPADLKAAVVDAARMYRDGLRNALNLPLYGRYFTPTDMFRRQTLDPDFERMVKRTLKQSEKRTSARVASRTLEEDADGSLRFVEQPPILTRLEPEMRPLIDQVFESYRRSLPPNIALMLSQYTVVDVARRVVGVGSVGTRCFIIALADPTGDVQILQLKEANLSVIEEFGHVPPAFGYLDAELQTEHQGYRVVGCQRILQAVSDPFLGYLNLEQYSFYMRMFRNRNASFEIAAMNRNQFTTYAQACSVVLARAHARSPKASYAAGYMGKGDSFARAVAEWSHAYAVQAEIDYDLFAQAARDGYYAA
ncbi:DUF2252 domain-containing protein [Planctomonas sp. JC2975]|uniref:DUF2252 domain-containing protein n=1 Tax=Planctomonas sp. JC2975 TaxID=2729626 RepID=UPI001F0FD580|nr:DUF2252 domain-containing protein [Planctomonas sp. JC2975]